MMQSCTSAAKLRSGGPILPVGMKAKWFVEIPGCSAFSVHCAGRSIGGSVTTVRTARNYRDVLGDRREDTVHSSSLIYICHIQMSDWVYRA